MSLKYEPSSEPLQVQPLESAWDRPPSRPSVSRAGQKSPITSTFVKLTLWAEFVNLRLGRQRSPITSRFVKLTLWAKLVNLRLGHLWAGRASPFVDRGRAPHVQVFYSPPTFVFFFITLKPRVE